MGGQDDIVITTSKIEKGEPKEPLMPLLAHIVEYFRGKEINPIVEQATKNFFDDENFVKHRGFITFLRRDNIRTLEAKCNKIKEEKHKFYTNSGRIVYGGGGIKPDIIIEQDTLNKFEILRKLSANFERFL